MKPRRISITRDWWTTEELSAEAGVSPRALTAWGKLGVVPKPGHGPNAGFDSDGRVRVLAVARVARQGYFGQALVDRFKNQTPAQLRALAGLPPLPSEATIAPPSIHSTWLRVNLAPGIEVNIDVTRADAKNVEAMLKLVTAAVTPAK